MDLVNSVFVFVVLFQIEFRGLPCDLNPCAVGVLPHVGEAALSLFARVRQASGFNKKLMSHHDADVADDLKGFDFGFDAGVFELASRIA